MHEVALADPPLRITPVSIVPSRNTLQAQHADRELSLATCNASLLECIQANNQSGVVFFRELGNWLRVLSDQQYLKNIALGECVATGLADSIGIAIAGGYSEELAGLEVKIDRDFVNDERHARSWLATVAAVTRKVQRRGYGVELPATWTASHPFVSRFGGANFNLAPLFDEHVFHDSHLHWELRIADVCATVFRRAHSGRGAVDAHAAVFPLLARKGEIFEVIVTGAFHPDDERRGSGP